MKIFQQVTAPPQLNDTQQQHSTQDQMSPISYRDHNVKQILNNRKNTSKNYKAMTARRANGSLRSSQPGSRKEKKVAMSPNILIENDLFDAPFDQL